jgi:hypothetical protein
MSFGAPPSKAEQDREASIRNEASGIEPGSPRDGIPEIIGEDTPPTPIPAPAEHSIKHQQMRTSPLNRQPVRSSRKTSPSASQERRAKEREQFIAHEVERSRSSSSSRRPTTTTRQRQRSTTTPPAPEAKTYELKVNGQTASVSREQLLAMADLSAEDAEGLPDAALIKSAQITEAARRRLAAAKETPFGAAAGSGCTRRNTSGEPMSHNAEQNPEQSARATPARSRKPSRKCSTATPRKHRSRVCRRPRRSPGAALGTSNACSQVAARIQNDAIEAFGQKNPDLYATRKHPSTF